MTGVYEGQGQKKVLPRVVRSRGFWNYLCRSQGYYQPLKKSKGLEITFYRHLKHILEALEMHLEGTGNPSSSGWKLGPLERCLSHHFHDEACGTLSSHWLR